jgi:hypothetical protein
MAAQTLSPELIFRECETREFLLYLDTLPEIVRSLYQNRDLDLSIYQGQFPYYFWILQGASIIGLLVYTVGSEASRRVHLQHATCTNQNIFDMVLVNAIFYIWSNFPNEEICLEL